MLDRGKAMQKILVVEDDVIICGGVKLLLENKGFEVECAYSLKEARLLLQKSFHLVILDCNLPDGSGIELCRELRERKSVSVIFLTANDTEKDMIEGFQAGCDDYIAKPFSVELLVQRVMAVLRRSSVGAVRDLFEYRELAVDFQRMQVFLKGNPIKLSATEYKLLELLVKNKGQVLTRNTILEKIWDCNENYVDENTLNVHIRRLRQKLEEDAREPRYIVTVFGIGYTFGEGER